MKKFIRGLVAGVMMLLMSLVAHGMSLAQSDDNALRDAEGLWSTDAEGRWMFCAFVVNEDGAELAAAKCWKVPGQVTASRDAYFKN
jgi:hypothetical protein